MKQTETGCWRQQAWRRELAADGGGERSGRDAEPERRQAAVATPGPGVAPEAAAAAAAVGCGREPHLNHEAATVDLFGAGGSRPGRDGEWRWR